VARAVASETRATFREPRQEVTSAEHLVTQTTTFVE
jgi:hypothetical protein